MIHEDVLFETWNGDEATLADDLAAVLSKHGVADPEATAAFLEATHAAIVDAAGSTSEFTTTMFMLHKSAHPKRFSYGPERARA